MDILEVQGTFNVYDLTLVIFTLQKFELILELKYQMITIDSNVLPIKKYIKIQSTYMLILHVSIF